MSVEEDDQVAKGRLIFISSSFVRRSKFYFIFIWYLPPIFTLDEGRTLQEVAS